MESVRHRPQLSLRTALVACAALLLTVACAAFIVEARVALGIAVASALVAAALHHAVDSLRRHHFSRASSLVSVLVAFVAALVGVVMIIAPAAMSQGRALVSEAPDYVARLRSTEIYRVVDQRFHIEQSLSTYAPGSIETAKPALQAVGGLLTFVAELVSAFFIIVFMLIFGESLAQSMLNAVPDGRRETYADVARRIYESVGGYLGGLAFICVVNATLTTTFLAIARVPSFVALGILSGFSSLVPYAGPVASGVVISAIAAAAKGPWTGLATVIYFGCYGQLEGQLLGPLVFRRTVHVNPLTTLLAVLFMVDAFGVIGAIIAVPVVNALQIILGQVTVNSTMPTRRGAL
jgi:predicted PurR-regulated permease PerM